MSVSITLCVQVNFLDWVVFNVALFATMFAGVDLGLAISIGLSVVLALYKSAFPKTSVLGQLPETSVFRCASRCTATLGLSHGARPCLSIHGSQFHVRAGQAQLQDPEL